MGCKGEKRCIFIAAAAALAVIVISSSASAAKAAKKDEEQALNDTEILLMTLIDSHGEKRAANVSSSYIGDDKTSSQGSVIAAMTETDRRLGYAARGIRQNTKAEAVAVFPLELSGTKDPPVTSPFGMREDPFDNKPRFHSGTDFDADEGDAVLAALDGVVVMARQSNEGYGNCVALLHENDSCTLYAHCDKLLCKETDVVAAGQTIACAGDSGNATGAHLHFEYITVAGPQDPMSLFYEE